MFLVPTRCTQWPHSVFSGSTAIIVAARTKGFETHRDIVTTIAVSKKNLGSNHFHYWLVRDLLDRAKIKKRKTKERKIPRKQENKYRRLMERLTDRIESKRRWVQEQEQHFSNAEPTHSQHTCWRHRETVTTDGDTRGLETSVNRSDGRSRRVWRPGRELRLLHNMRLSGNMWGKEPDIRLESDQIEKVGEENQRRKSYSKHAVCPMSSQAARRMVSFCFALESEHLQITIACRGHKAVHKVPCMTFSTQQASSYFFHFLFLYIYIYIYIYIFPITHLFFSSLIFFLFFITFSIDLFFIKYRRWSQSTDQGWSWFLCCNVGVVQVCQYPPLRLSNLLKPLCWVWQYATTLPKRGVGQLPPPRNRQTTPSSLTLCFKFTKAEVCSTPPPRTVKPLLNDSKVPPV